MILAEWHVTPEYLDREWTEEELRAMLEMRNRRIRRLNRKDEPAKPKLLQLGAKYLNDPAFLAQHKVN